MEAVVNHDDLGNYSHAEVRAMREQISTLQRQLSAEKERADYAWRNAALLDKIRVDVENERDHHKQRAALLAKELERICA